MASVISGRSRGAPESPDRIPRSRAATSIQVGAEHICRGSIPYTGTPRPVGCGAVALRALRRRPGEAPAAVP